jgi:hypothetical protein
MNNMSGLLVFSLRLKPAPPEHNDGGGGVGIIIVFISFGCLGIHIEVYLYLLLHNMATSKDIIWWMQKHFIGNKSFMPYASHLDLSCVQFNEIQYTYFMDVVSV